VNKAEEWYWSVINELIEYTPWKVEGIFGHLMMGDARDKEYWREIYRSRKYPCLFYQFLAMATRKYQYKQYVEIGADRGVSTIMVASEMPAGGKVISIDHCDGVSYGDNAWKYVPPFMTNILKMEMDSLDIQKIHDAGIDLSQTDFWLIDGEHTYQRVRKECELYKPYWKQGAVVLFDDLIRIQPAFDELQYEHKCVEVGHLHGVNEGSGIIYVT